MINLLKYPRTARSSARFLNNSKGFTLLELIAALVLLGLLSAIFGMGLVAAMQSHEFSRANVRLAQKVQPAMARITRELTELTNVEDWDPSDPNDFIIYHRIPDQDDSVLERYGLQFDAAANQLLLYTQLPAAQTSLNGGGDLLLDEVRSFDFNLFSTESVPWTGGNIQLLSSIEIVLEVFQPGNRNVFHEFRTIVHLRNNSNFGGAVPRTRPASEDDYACFISALKTER